MNPLASPIVVQCEGRGESGWCLYVSRGLQCVLVDKKTVDRYEEDVTWDKLATRRLTPTWLAWLRFFHSGTKEDAVELAKLIQGVMPELVGSTAPVPKNYLPPFAMQFQFFADQGQGCCAGDNAKSPND